MRLTLLESNRPFLQKAESTFVSLLVHGGVIWFALSATAGGRQIPTDAREARVFFLLPPDRVDEHSRQPDHLHWAKLGGDLTDGKLLTQPGEGYLIRERAYGARRRGGKTGARGELPFGPPPQYMPDTVFSVLEVDKMVERYESSAAPVYPRELIALGMEGLVQTRYVVDTTGMVDTASVEVVQSDDPRFSESVRNALGQARFRPAIRAGKPVRQLVVQQFRFRIEPTPVAAKQMS
jgi:TonB family protein